MLQKTYSIYSDDLNDVQLFAEAGKNHIACWCKKAGEKILKAFEFFLCDDYTAENFEEVLDNTRAHSRLLTMPVSNTNFFWNTNEALCLPKEKEDADFVNANFELMFGRSPNTKIFFAPSEQCLIAWRIEDAHQHIAQESFRGASFAHHYVPLLPSLRLMNANAAHLLFYPHHFTLVIFKDGRLLFAQTRTYNVPEDVLYLILNACIQYNLEKNIEIITGGFITEDSKLYDMLYQYLEGLQLIKADETLFGSDEFKKYPSHYFLPYINYVV